MIQLATLLAITKVLTCYLFPKAHAQWSKKEREWDESELTLYLEITRNLT